MTETQKQLVIAMGEFTSWLTGLTAAANRLDGVIKSLPADSDPEFEQLRKRFIAARPKILRIGLAATDIANTVDPTRQGQPTN